MPELVGARIFLLQIDRLVGIIAETWEHDPSLFFHPLGLAETQELR